VKYEPKLGIICGSGLGGLAETVEEKEIIGYNEIDGFPVSTGSYL
jgi:purine-nucleoside phosphorylase